MPADSPKQCSVKYSSKQCSTPVGGPNALNCSLRNNLDSVTNAPRVGLRGSCRRSHHQETSENSAPLRAKQANLRQGFAWKEEGLNCRKRNNWPVQRHVQPCML